MKFISVCSGIEAASVAFHPLGWQAVAFSEIEPFPSAVLAHHYPRVPNFGDMNDYPYWPDEIFLEADAVVGGPPCQAFSVAGLRAGLHDDRGNLTLTYAELINHADALRAQAGKPPVVVLYENVPGLLSDKTNAFGCLLAGLAGEDEPLVPTGTRWPNAGYVLGPQRAVAWRILDAQYFGLAQRRRRRVFVVASARDGFDPATVLFEWEGVRRDSPPRREAGKVAPTIPSRSTGGGDLGTDFDCDGGLIHADPIARCITTGEAKRQDWETCNFVAHTLKAEGFDASEDGTGRGTPLVPVAFNARQDPDHRHDRTGPLDTDGGTQAVAFAQNSRDEVRLEGGDGQRCGALSTGGGKPGQGVPMVAVQASQSGVRLNETVGTLDANYGSRRHNGVMSNMQVRRLTPTECARLQGFPDDYLDVLYRGKPAADGPKYKALGNSWAVPVVRWIGARIQEAV